MFGLDIRSNGKLFDVAVHTNGNSVTIIECEPSVPEPELNSAALVRSMISRLQKSENLRLFYRLGAREMRALTGFDRVMVYRFDHDDSGEVVAEAARSGLESYLGLHYPASDIPKQARILYEKNWLRIIADIGATPSLIVSDKKHSEPPDLSLSILRSVSPIHIEYLQNMGVGASMSVSIIRNGKLWGLFACHHYGPWHVSYERRTAAELFGQMFSLLLEGRERESEIEHDTRGRKLHDELMASMAADGTSFDTILSHLDEIADLLSCDGIAAYIDDKITLSGQTPTADQIAAIAAFLNKQHLRQAFETNHLAAIYPAAKEFVERVAGMLAIPLSRPARDYIMFFRKEVARTVAWAGNPVKPALIGPLGDRLTPRKSFDLWRGTVSEQSTPWTPVDLRIADSLRVSLLEVILRLTDVAMKERRAAQSRQELLIAELNHRVRNILGLIRGLIAQSRDGHSTVDNFISVVGGRIHALARAHDQITSENWSPASFHKLIKLEGGAYLGDKADRLRFTGPDVLLLPNAFTTVALVMHEMITNSAKYGALKDSCGHVDITTAFDQTGDLSITWREHGGPDVKPPTRRGFGTTIIERSIPFDLQGRADIEYAPSGLRGHFIIPTDHFRFVGKAVAAEPPKMDATERKKPLKGLALVVEDNLIIALDAEANLLDLGADDVTIVSNIGAALDAIEKRKPYAALLDVNLGAETSFAVGERLIALSVPFAFASGYGEKIAYPEIFSATPKILKPYTLSMLQDALVTAIQSSQKTASGIKSQ
jgi:light-regulated signal transduction histidine kinase (bacteriophytochrome)